MCLIQNTAAAEMSLYTGRLCVMNFPMLHADKGMYISIDNMPVDGVIGISPARTEHNFIRKLKEQHQIDDAIIGINYEPYGVAHL